MRKAGGRRRVHPVTFHGGVALLAAVACTLLLWWGLSGHWRWQPWLAAWLAGVNGTAFAYYAWDKARARRQGRRVPEVVLHGLAVVGGSLGAYLGMQVFRHKTLKGIFRLVFWLIVALQGAVLVWLIKSTSGTNTPPNFRRNPTKRLREESAHISVQVEISDGIT